MHFKICATDQILSEWTKQKNMKWAEHVARMVEIRNKYKAWVGKKIKGGDKLGDPGVDGTLNIKYVNYVPIARQMLRLVKFLWAI